MQIALITVSISPHQLPLARQLANAVGPENFRYICDKAMTKGRSSLGWQLSDIPKWVIIENSSKLAKKEAHVWMLNSDVIISGKRNFSLFEKRVASGKLTFYMSERWLKPPLGAGRLFFPHYLLMAWRVLNLLKSDKFNYLAMGVHAASDMLRLYGFFNKSLNFSEKTSEVKPFFKQPLSDFKITKKNGLRVENNKEITSSDDFVLKHILLWGYFVDKTSQVSKSWRKETSILRILWVGRLLSLKKVDTLIQAIKSLIDSGADIQLTIIGKGPQKKRLERLLGLNTSHNNNDNLVEGKLQNRIIFLSPVAVTEVRKHMQMSDIYVLPSNALEGWGAVVNEAMEEGCAVIASRESGAGITLIEHGKNGLLFESGNVEELKHSISICYNDRYFLSILKNEARKTMDNYWGAEHGAENILRYIKELYEK